MKFADGMKEVIANLEPILAISEILTTERVAQIGKLSDIDVGKMNKAIKSAKFLKDNSKRYESLIEYLPEISNVNQIRRDIIDVANMRSILSIVSSKSGQISAVNELAPSIIQCNGLEPTLKDVVAMKPEIEEVLKNADKIEDINQTASDMQGALQQMEDMYLKIGVKFNEMKEMEANIAAEAKSVRDNLELIRLAHKELQEFQIKTFIIESDRKGYSKYESSENTLNLFIPKGQEGEKGDKGEIGRRGQRGIPGTATNQGAIGETGQPGRNGNDFAINIYGMLREKSMYGNRPVGTSFLSLDETPTMIYFRKSNALDDWTEGQPFGIGNGDFSLAEIAGAVIQLFNEKGATNGNQ